MLEYKIRPVYGVDAPGVIRGFLIAGVVAAAAGRGVSSIRALPKQVRFVSPLLLYTGGLTTTALAASMLAYAVRGKLNYRDFLLSSIDWRGDESVLDIGTGRGLLAIGAAKRLTSGRVVGTDIWKEADLSGNTVGNASTNAAVEGVLDRVDFKHEDARTLSFADASFDVVLSLLCVHIAGAGERERVCREIARVLKPGGVALISDHTNTAAYAGALSRAGLLVERSGLQVRESYGLMRTVTARKTP